MDFLNSKERKAFFSELHAQYGYVGNTEYVVWTPGNGKYYVVSRAIEQIPYMELRLKHAGLHVATRARDGLRLTLDGAIAFGPHCTHEPVRLDDTQRDAWMRGETVHVSGPDRWTVVAWRTDILGCGKVRAGELLNYVPKERRIQDPH